MLTSFYTGISGLSANALTLSVVGNNLANVNTVGFKASAISFQDLLSANWSGVNSGGNPMQIGLGTQTASVSPKFSQGSVKDSTEASDVAINGNGFFIVKNTAGAQMYTRAGNFTFNSSGQLVTQQGYNLQGWMATNGVVNPNGPLENIIFNPGAACTPAATTAATLQINLDAQTATTATAPHYSSSATVYDSLGQSHTLNFTFTKTATNTWSYAVTSTEAGVTVTGGTGTMSFGPDGALSSPTGPINLGVTLTNGASNIAIAWNLQDEAGNPVLTQHAAASSTSKTDINGYPAGNLTSFGVDGTGLVQGIYSNGQVQILGQLALASFTNTQGLAKSGGNCYAESYSSGEPAIGQAGTGGRGSLSGNALELSNVDIATEFTQLIIAQRGYQANSRVITTSDEVLQEAVNLKR